MSPQHVFERSPTGRCSLPHHLAKGLALLLLLSHALGHPLLVTAQLVVSFDLQELHLLFAPVPLPLQSHKLQHRREEMITPVLHLTGWIYGVLCKDLVP